MSALALGAQTPARLPGRIIVRAAGRMDLHITATTQIPAAAMFTVPLDCAPDQEAAPGVRPWTGPLDENRLCPECRHALNTEPASEPAEMAEARPEPTRPTGRWPVLL
ncbi:hypothetical protein [Streptomyces sp. NPDC048577]|uniref:hypothetical protein n=1 Tax=Streptomyces sp. NPDC048577 TaxID=3157209 RepID=UPI00342B538A